MKNFIVSAIVFLFAATSFAAIPCAHTVICSDKSGKGRCKLSEKSPINTVEDIGLTSGIYHFIGAAINHETPYTPVQCVYKQTSSAKGTVLYVTSKLPLKSTLNSSWSKYDDNWLCDNKDPAMCQFIARPVSKTLILAELKSILRIF